MSRWIAHERIKPEGKINLLCFAYPGGSASSFAPWKKKINEKINLIPILYPEREIRKKEKMQETFTEFINDFIKENEELFKLPYAFFGYCGGAVIGYEIAIKARRFFGKLPIWGIIASSEAPEYLKDSLVPFPNGNEEKEMVDYLLSLKMFDENILKNRMFLDYYIPLLKADCKMLETYTYEEKEKLNCNLDILYGEDDQTVRFEKAKKWEMITLGKTNIEKRKGGHFFIDKEKDYVCDLINERLITWLERNEK